VNPIRVNILDPNPTRIWFGSKISDPNRIFHRKIRSSFWVPFKTLPSSHMHQGSKKCTGAINMVLTCAMNVPNY